MTYLYNSNDPTYPTDSLHLGLADQCFSWARIQSLKEEIRRPRLKSQKIKKTELQASWKYFQVCFRLLLLSYLCSAVMLHFSKRQPGESTEIKTPHSVKMFTGWRKREKPLFRILLCRNIYQSVFPGYWEIRYEVWITTYANPIKTPNQLCTRLQYAVKME